jgi:hypothetical protein
MKKALIGLWVCSFLLIVTCIAVLSADPGNAISCNKLATVSSIDKPSGIDSQKSYALRFPVL